jgi:hypothetical protein
MLRNQSRYSELFFLLSHILIKFSLTHTLHYAQNKFTSFVNFLLPFDFISLALLDFLFNVAALDSTSFLPWCCIWNDIKFVLVVALEGRRRSRVTLTSIFIFSSLRGISWNTKKIFTKIKCCQIMPRKNFGWLIQLQNVNALSASSLMLSRI